MKILVITTVILSFSFNSLGQTPQKVEGIAVKNHSMEWYREQSKAWRKVLDKEPKKANAWYNYYYANRMLAKDNSNPNQEKRKKQIENILDSMKLLIPNTFEYNLCRWKAGGNSMELLPYLKKARELGEGRTEHLCDLINIAELNRDIKERNKQSLKMLETWSVSSGMLHYNYNTLVGLKPNAILITVGDNDTYPAWVLQARGIRPDIKVVNFSFLSVDDYREKLFKELQIKPWDKVWSHPEKASEQLEKFNKEIVLHMTQNGKNYPLYLDLSASGNKKITDPLEPNLYLTGLAYEYCEKNIDNIAVLRHNFEQKYLLDYLQFDYFPDPSRELVKMTNRNYLLPMIQLYRHYNLTGEEVRKNRIKDQMMAIAKGTQSEEKVLQLIKESEE